MTSSAAQVETSSLRSPPALFEVREAWGARREAEARARAGSRIRAGEALSTGVKKSREGADRRRWGLVLSFSAKWVWVQPGLPSLARSRPPLQSCGTRVPVLVTQEKKPGKVAGKVDGAKGPRRRDAEGGARRSQARSLSCPLRSCDLYSGLRDPAPAKPTLPDGPLSSPASPGELSKIQVTRGQSDGDRAPRAGA